jgi:hypothetical protein
MNQAVFVKNLESWNGDAKLYKLLPLMVTMDYDDKTVETHEFVIVSAVDAMFSGPETYIFPATEDGEAKSYTEMDGSFRGGKDHAEALRGAGYEAVDARLPPVTPNDKLKGRHDQA